MYIYNTFRTFHLKRCHSIFKFFIVKCLFYIIMLMFHFGSFAFSYTHRLFKLPYLFCTFVHSQLKCYIYMDTLIPEQYFNINMLIRLLQLGDNFSASLLVVV